MFQGEKDTLLVRTRTVNTRKPPSKMAQARLFLGFNDVPSVIMRNEENSEFHQAKAYLHLHFDNLLKMLDKN